MNIGLYIDSLGDEKAIKLFIDTIEQGFLSNKLDDASIFYDSVSFTPFNFPCGLFNSTELWNFSGKLLVFSLESLRNAVKIVNNIEIYYVFGFEESINILAMLDLVSSNEISVITKNNLGMLNFYRISGKKVNGSLEDKSLMSLLI
jgi:hypothetical protein